MTCLTMPKDVATLSSDRGVMYDVGEHHGRVDPLDIYCSYQEQAGCYFIRDAKSDEFSGEFEDKFVIGRGLMTSVLFSDKVALNVTEEEVEFDLHVNPYPVCEENVIPPGELCQWSGLAVIDAFQYVEWDGSYVHALDMTTGDIASYLCRQFVKMSTAF